MFTPGTSLEEIEQWVADNLANLTPHPFTVFLLYSHPPLLQRIAALLDQLLLVVCRRFGHLAVLCVRAIGLV